MKKSLLLIFGVLGLVSLMAESGPKRSSILSKLGLADEPMCCDISVCCADSSPSCCDISTCCAIPVGCCSAPTVQNEEKVTSEPTSKSGK
ncbi:MAG: hypothetical protein IPM42_20695 [Saprospiraceae bacterium]|nr:hypothetical protein [Saprospiraceae bacterium]